MEVGDGKLDLAVAVGDRGEGAVTTELAPPWSRSTTLPVFGRPSESLSVTVIVSAVLPSAGSVLRLATIPADAAGGGTNVNTGFSVMITPSVVSVAVIVTGSTLRSVTVKARRAGYRLLRCWA